MAEQNELQNEEAIKIPDVLPVLPLKDLAIFPYIIVPLSVSREKSINAVDQSLAENRVIMLSAQKDYQNEDPGEDDVHRVGTVAIIMRMLKLPDGRIRILVQGLSRARIDYFIQTAPFFKAKITRLEEQSVPDKTLEVEAMIRSIKQNLDKAVNLGKAISPEVMVIAANLDDPARLADLAASNLDLKLDEAQGLLETIDPLERLKRVNDLLNREINVLQMQQEISSAAQGEMNKTQTGVLPPPADEGNPVGAWRGRGARRGNRELPQQDRREEDERRGEGRGRETDPASRTLSSGFGRNLDYQDVPGLDDGAAVGRDVGRQPRPRPRA